MGGVVAIDTRGDALRHALAATPDLIKVNDLEAGEVLGSTIETDDDALTAAGDLARRSGAPAAAYP